MSAGEWIFVAFIVAAIIWAIISTFVQAAKDADSPDDLSGDWKA